MAKGANNTPNTRKRKAARGEERVIKDKFAEQRRDKRNEAPLKPLNPKQREYIHSLHTKSMVIATGLPGTSKTYIPTVMACDDYLAGAIDQIYLTRPAISNSKSLGYWSGSVSEKLGVWMGPVLSVMRERLGPEALEIAIRHGDIQFVPFEVIKGYSFKNCWVILDEAEDINIDEAKKFVTRLGENSRVALAGDLSQSELGGKSGLKKLVELYQKDPELKSRVAHIDFDSPSDIVRSDLCRNWILVFRRDELG